MPKEQNTYGSRALDLELDRLRKSIVDLQKQIAALSPSTAIPTSVQPTPPFPFPDTGPPFATYAKWSDIPIVPGTLSFVSQAKWEND